VPSSVGGQGEELLRAACHQLRTHLSCALLSGQLLQDEALRRGLDEAARRAGNVVAAVLRMDALLEELSESAYLACGPIELQRQSLQLEELLAVAMRGIADPHDPTGLAPLRVDVHAAPDLPAVSVDAARMSRALRCMLTHALGVTAAGRVEVALAGADGEVRLTVADHGPGIPRDQLGGVFARFFRGSGGGSAGVGLFIARTLVEAHGGRVWVESEVGRGATYGLAVPAAPPPDARRGRPPRRSSR